MSFKPRIFISSLLKEKLEIRSQIQNFFVSVGAEPLLYEKNLTPSSNLYTYRQDIMDSDFVIIILDENYGSVTDSGLSGTEEEFNIATRNKLKTHVYIKDIKKEKKRGAKAERKFIERIKKSGISYYLYDNDKDLFKHIKQTVMRICREIVLNSLSSKTVEKHICMRVASEYDYSYALEFIAVYEKMIEIEKLFSHTEYYVMGPFMEPLYDKVIRNPFLFIDTKYYELLLNALNIANEYIGKMSLEFSAGEKFHTVDSPVIGEVYISKNTSNPYETPNLNWYREKWIMFNTSFNEFIKYAKNQKLKIDSLFM